MASKSKEQLENELTEALALVEALQSEKTKLLAELESAKADNAALLKDLEHLESRLKEVSKSKPVDASDVPLSADEKAIRERVLAGLTRQQAEHAHKAQKEHDAAMKGASEAAAK